jgi:hypothetical protein
MQMRVPVAVLPYYKCTFEGLTQQVTHGLLLMWIRRRTRHFSFHKLLQFLTPYIPGAVSGCGCW